MTLELLWQREEEIRERNQQDKRRKGETQKCRKRPKRKTHDLSLSDHHEKKTKKRLEITLIICCYAVLRFTIVVLLRVFVVRLFFNVLSIAFFFCCSAQPRLRHAILKTYYSLPARFILRCGIAAREMAGKFGGFDREEPF